RYEHSCAARTPARQSVVLPMPTAPSSRRLQGPAELPATNSWMVVSSASRPTTPALGGSNTGDICRVSRGSHGLGREVHPRHALASTESVSCSGLSAIRWWQAAVELLER